MTSSTPALAIQCMSILPLLASINWKLQIIRKKSANNWARMPDPIRRFEANRDPEYLHSATDFFIH
ncbi:hypothetical protein [Burkholderia dolosa]|uniref:hypothetical protein n=1 Tax=Burkholderia dolosa TaxID=152500 RepID=UPI00167F9DC9|nr:hypothetical protein [Burkholderia dolosa]MBY4916414.1 hypothetical protein [Burkholderia dolosa]MCC5028944.1 hypothetical protein [Burkholderia dolosa]